MPVNPFEPARLGPVQLRNRVLKAATFEGTATAGTCVHCNKCVPSIYSGTRCVLDHPDPIIATGPR